MTVSRRGFLKAALASGAGVTLSPLAEAAGVSQPRPAEGVPGLIHVTDLFHPHGDPDDHFDLACAYALAARGNIDLRGLVIDYPPDFRPGDPAAAAVAQLNWLSGLAVPMAIGTSRRLAHRKDPLVNAPKQETAAVAFIIRQLRAAETPRGVGVRGIGGRHRGRRPARAGRCSGPKCAGGVSQQRIGARQPGEA